jgi:pentatricopeptide repeat protein
VCTVFIGLHIVHFTACLVCKQYEEVIALLRDMLRRNLKPSPTTFANGMAAYGALNNYEGAVKLLPSMRSFNVSICMTYTIATRKM